MGEQRSAGDDAGDDQEQGDEIQLFDRGYDGEEKNDGGRRCSPPVDGAANEALIAWLAKQLGVPRSAIVVRSGATGRLKLLRIDGDGAALGERLAVLANC